jgi:hypothetical protein
MQTFGVVQYTAEDIARKYGNDDLVSMLAPKKYRQIPNEILASLQRQLHDLIKYYASEHVRFQHGDIGNQMRLIRILDKWASFQNAGPVRADRNREGRALDSYHQDVWSKHPPQIFNTI